MCVFEFYKNTEKKKLIPCTQILSINPLSTSSPPAKTAEHIHLTHIFIAYHLKSFVYVQRDEKELYRT